MKYIGKGKIIDEIKQFLFHDVWRGNLGQKGARVKQARCCKVDIPKMHVRSDYDESDGETKR